MGEIKISKQAENELLTNVLLLGSGFEGGINRIYHHFQKNLPAAENIDFLKNEYGVGSMGARDMDVSYDAKGLMFRYKFQDYKRWSWKTIESKLKKLVQNGDYSPKPGIEESTRTTAWLWLENFDPTAPTICQQAVQGTLWGGGETICTKIPVHN